MSVQEEVLDGTAVEVYQPPQDRSATTLFRTDDPVQVIETATKVADALKRVVTNRGLVSNIKGKEFPRVEAWQTLGAMLGVFPTKEWVKPIPWPSPVPEALVDHHKRGLCFGFEASYRAQARDGSVVGGGEADCRRTESHWTGSDDFAIKSMAQTRAISKALSSPLRFVMVLAGYEATPAEEMDGVVLRESRGNPAPSSAPSGAPRPSARPAQDTARRASAKQRGLINVRAAEGRLAQSDLATVVLIATGNEERTWASEEAAKTWLERALEQLPARSVDAVLDGIRAWGPSS